ncbi:MAG: prepilin-type N-terminal cleavage/methylation domain-containing protein [Limisphaera sp.]|nr:prepilin-type N-terminal cleavage/methylation domain-containing protein [Limisphaera sp.]
MDCKTTFSTTEPRADRVRRSTSCRGRTASGGFTLTETMVTMALAGVILAAVLGFWTFSARTLAGITNYMDLDQRSRHALDVLSREIRQAAGLLAATPTSLTFSNLDGTTMQIVWDPDRRIVTLRRDTQVETLLTGWDYLRFNISQRNPSNAVFGFYPTRDIRQAKLVDLSWRCTRQILGQTLQTESVQTARIVIRN